MNTPQSRPLRIGGVPEHFNLPWHLAIENGDFSAADLNVEYHEFPGGTGAMTAALRDDQLDVAMVLTEGAVADILQGGEHKIVNVYVDSPLVWGIHVAADSPFESVDDIAGGKYAISRHGSGSHLIPIVDASIRGWPIETMQFVKVGNLDGARKALAEGAADVFFWEKFMTQPLVDSGEFRRVGERTVPWPSFVASVRQDVLVQSRPLIRQTFEIINRTCRALMNNPAAESIIADRYHLNLEDARKWLAHVQWSTDFALERSMFEAVVDSLLKLDIVDQQAVETVQFWERL